MVVSVHLCFCLETGVCMSVCMIARLAGRWGIGRFGGISILGGSSGMLNLLLVSNMLELHVCFASVIHF